MNSVSDIYLFSSLSFSVCCVFKSRICNVHLLSVFIFLSQPPLKVCVATRNYRAKIIHHFIVVLFLYFFYYSSCRKEGTVYCFKFMLNSASPVTITVRRTEKNSGCTLYHNDFRTYHGQLHIKSYFF